MKHVTPKIFVKQLFIKDLLGKDCHRGVSLTYAWLANQLGHFTLGFIPSIVLSLFFNNISPLKFSVYVMGFWTLFELINLTMPIFVTLKKVTFKPKWAHLILDTLTDLLYFYFGALVSAYLLTRDKEVGVFTIIVLLLLCYPFVYWYTTRIYQQYAYFPFQFRISQWVGNIDENEKKIVSDFIDNRTVSKKHLLIFGNIQEGKTNLGVAIANEIALKKQSCNYISATKLYSSLLKDTKNNDLLWDWKSCDYLIIDDVNPDYLEHNQLLSPFEFLKYVDCFTEANVQNRAILKNKNIIWVLGSNEKIHKNDWLTVLKEIGIKENEIFTINVSD